MKERASLEIAFFSSYNSLKDSYVRWAAYSPYAHAKTALWLCLFCVCASFPNYDYFLQPNHIVARNWAVLDQQAANPLTPMHFPSEKHEGQLAFRFLLPGIAHILHFPVGMFFAFLPLAAWGFFLGIQKWLAKAGLAPWSVMLISLGLAATYIGKSFFMDLLGYFDAYCYLLLLAGILVRSPFLATLAFLAAIHIDERAYLAAPLCAFARMAWREDDPSTISLQKLLQQALPALVAIVFGLAIRWWLHSQFGLSSGMQSQNLGLVTLRDNFITMSIGTLSGLDGWLLIGFLPAFYLWRRGNLLIGSGYLLYMLASLVALNMVLDVTRCMAYLFPAALAGIVFLAKEERPAFTEKVLAIFCGIALLLPPLFVVGKDVVWMGPIIPKIVRLVAVLAFGKHI